MCAIVPDCTQALRAGLSLPVPPWGHTALTDATGCPFPAPSPCMGTLVPLRCSTCCSCIEIFFVAISIREVPSITGIPILSTTPKRMYEVSPSRATPMHTERTMGIQPPLTSWNMDANSPSGWSLVPSGSNGRLSSMGRHPVSRMAGEIRPTPSFRHKLRACLNL